VLGFVVLTKKIIDIRLKNISANILYYNFVSLLKSCSFILEDH
jgi:hypothetical protein